MSNLTWFAAIVGLLVTVACATKPEGRGPCCERHRHDNPEAGDVVYCAVRGR